MFIHAKIVVMYSSGQVAVLRWVAIRDMGCDVSTETRVAVLKWSERSIHEGGQSGQRLCALATSQYVRGNSDNSFP